MDDPDPAANLIGQLILLVFLTLLNAFFASAEIAVVSLNKNRIKMMADKGDKKAALLLRTIEEPTRFLSTIQVGITLGGFFASASAATGLSEPLGRALGNIGVPYGGQVAFVGITLILSYFTLVFGELVPKRIAQKKPERVARFSIQPIHWLSVVATPFIKLLSLSTGGCMRLLGMKDEEDEEVISKEELRTILEEGQEDGAIDAAEKQMIEGVFGLSQKRASEIMTPRTDVFMLNLDHPLSEYIDEMKRLNYSRIPVYQGSIDDIVGILYLKDLMWEAKPDGYDQVDVKSLLKEPYFVPESKQVGALFQELRASQNHIAILVDEYGGFSGIVTMEDLVEEVMGNIEDEYDNELDKKKWQEMHRQRPN